MDNEIYDCIVESYEMGDITLEEAYMLAEAVNKKALAIGAGVGTAALGGIAGGVALYNKKKKEKAKLKAEMDKLEQEKKDEERKALMKEIKPSDNKGAAKENLTYKDLRQARLKNKIDEAQDNITARHNAREKESYRMRELKHGIDKGILQDDYEMMDVKRGLDKRIADDMYQTKDLERKSRIEDAKTELELQKINAEIRKITAQIQSEATPARKKESLKEKLATLLKRKEKISNK